MVFHRCFSDSKSPQVSRTLFSILAVLSNAVIWIVSTHRPNSKSSTPFDNPLVIVPKALITIGTIVTYMFHSFSLARSGTYPSFHIVLFLFCGYAGQQSPQFFKLCFFFVLFFLLIIVWSGLLAGIRWSVCMSKSHRSLCVSFSRIDFGLCIYHF